MATVKVSQAHSMSVADAKKRLGEVFSAYAAKFGIKQHWDGDKLKLNGSGFEGHANVTGKSIDVEVKLGLATSVFKGQVESNLKSELEKNFKA